MEDTNENNPRLEAGIRQGMNAQSDDDIAIQKKIQYYISSVMSQNHEKLEVAQDEIRAIPQDGQELTEAEKEQLRQNRQAESVALEEEKFLQKLQDCKTKEDLQQMEAAHLDSMNSAYQLVENSAELPTEQRREYTLLKDAKVSAIKKLIEQFMESDAYKILPAGVKSPQPTETEETETETETPEEMEARRKRAQNGYESVRQSIDEQEALESGKKVPFDAKG